MRYFKMVGAMCAALVLTLSVAGCAGGTMAKGPSDQELLDQMSTEFMAAVAAKDVEKLIGFCAEDFESGYLGDKAGFKDFLNMAVDQGYFDGIEIAMDEGELVIEGDTATKYPVPVDGSFGSVTVEVLSKKVDGVWKISGIDVQM
jgi:ketosteroid isomerase-like protein